MPGCVRSQSHSSHTDTPEHTIYRGSRAGATDGGKSASAGLRISPTNGHSPILAARERFARRRMWNCGTVLHTDQTPKGLNLGDRISCRGRPCQTPSMIHSQTEGTPKQLY